MEGTEDPFPSMNTGMDGPKVEKVLTHPLSRALVKPNHMLETPQKPTTTSRDSHAGRP